MKVREIVREDLAEWTRLRMSLWPDSTAEETRRYFARRKSDEVVFVIDRGDASLAGFIEMGTRDYAEYCETTPVAYIEGWFVEAEARRRGLGAKLVAAGERWAAAAGYREMASDSDILNEISIAAHKALGYTEVCRLVCFRKELEPSSPS